MDAQEIQTVLESGVVGYLSGERLWRWLRRGSHALNGLAEELVELGVVAARWQKPEAAEPDTELARAYLVLTLAESGTPHTPAEWKPLREFTPRSLEHIHTIAQGVFNCFFYSIKGQELWLEFMLASEQAMSEMKSVMEAGRIGRMPFPEFLHESSGVFLQTPTSMAFRLSGFGITKVRWEPYRLNDPLHWQAYLVATLPPSLFASPPGLPSEWLITRLTSLIASPDEHNTDVNGNDLELWLLYRVRIPIADTDTQLLQA